MEKIKNIPKKWKIATGLVLVLSISIISVCYFFMEKSNQGKEEKEQKVQEEQVEEGSYTAEGTTEVATVEQSAGFSLNEVELIVEEVYVQSGEEVEEGTPLYKLTDESVVALKEYYEEEVAAAQTKLETAQLNYETGVLEAEYTKETSLSEAEMAEDVYNASVEELENQVTSKQNEYNNAVSQINTYATNLNNNVYYVECGVEAAQQEANTAQQEADSAQQSYSAVQQEYNTAWTKVTADVAGLKQAVESEENTDMATLVETLNNDYDALASTKGKLEEAQKNLEQAQANLKEKKASAEQAQSSYEKAVKEAEQNKSQLESNLSKLSEEYEEAQQQLTLKKASLKNDYKKTVLAGDYAESSYESDVNSLEENVEQAQKNLEELQEQQAELLKIENGIITASQAGTLATVPYEAQDILLNDQALVSYYDVGTVSISVEIPQEYISQVKVGDNVNVTITGARNSIDGIVNKVATSATEGAGISSVTYAVEITIDNSDGSLSAGTGANVQFELEEGE